MRDPERLDKSSASSFEIIAECEGQPALLATLPPLVDTEPDPLADRGTRIHAALETESTADLSDDEVEDYNKLVRCEQSVLSTWMEDENLLGIDAKGREERFWMNDPATLEPVLSAKLDRWYISEDRALVPDFKTGAWNKRLTPSQRNFQLRVQAVLLWREFSDLKKIRVALVKPNRPADFTDYTDPDLEFAQSQILHVLWRTKQPDAIRRPGSHCNWCPCKDSCPEAAAYALLPSVLVGNGALDVVEAVNKLAPPDLVRIWERDNVVRKILDAVKARLKAFTDEELNALGLVRTPGRRLDPIVKTKDAFEFFRDKENISELELLEALSFGKGDLQRAIMRDKGWNGDATRGYLKQKLAPFIEAKQAEAGLERKE